METAKSFPPLCRASPHQEHLCHSMLLWPDNSPSVPIPINLPICHAPLLVPASGLRVVEMLHSMTFGVGL